MVRIIVEGGKIVHDGREDVSVERAPSKSGRGRMSNIGDVLSPLLLVGGLLVVGGIAYYIITKNLNYPQKGNILPISTIGVGGAGAGAGAGVGLDSFGIKQLYPSIGRNWFAKWGPVRKWTSQGFGQEVASRDPMDAETFLYCPKADAGFPNSASAANGILTLNGASLRFLVKKQGSTWGNVEITTYVRKVRTYGTGHTDAVINISGPSNHDLAYLCRMTGYAYYANVGSSGKEELLKELLHISNPTGGPDGYSLRKYPSNSSLSGLPTGKWIGYKLLVQNTNAEKYRRIRFYRDLTDGLNGGDWKLIADTTDRGTWGVSQSVWNKGDASSSNCKQAGMNPNTSPNNILNFPANSIQFRVYHNTIKLKKTSVREIAALA